MVTSAARARGFNQVSVIKCFDLLEQQQEKHRLTPDKMINVDETGITSLPNKPSRIIGSRRKSKKMVCPQLNGVNWLQLSFV